MYKGKPGIITLALTGDVMLAKRLPKKFSPAMLKASEFLKKHDCVLGNLETTIHDGEGIPEAYPGGGWAMASGHTLDDLADFGFNMFACANNHAMDYGQTGLISTIKNLKARDIQYAGIGSNLSEASQPAYFDCENGRISLISITSSFHDSYLAGPQNQDMKGRPGVNPLRHNAVYELNSDDFKSLVRIASESGINSYHAQAIKEGYIPSGSDTFKFGGFTFSEGSTGVLHTSPLNADFLRTLASIKDAKNMSDICIVSVHGHQFKGDKEQSPEFVETFSRACIDAGADVVFCHGPHLLRGIQCYSNGIILYGLGNFILQQDQMVLLPEEYYRKYGTTRQDTIGPSEAYLRQSANNTRGLNADARTWQSVIAGIEFNGENKVVSLQPIQLDRYGLPCAVSDNGILQKIAELSRPYGSVIQIENNIGKIRFDSQPTDTKSNSIKKKGGG